MANNKVEFEIKVIGDAIERLKQITGQTEDLGKAANATKKNLLDVGRVFTGLNQGIELFSKVSGQIKQYTDAYKAQSVAETQLAQVMKNTMGAGLGEVNAIKELTSAQQQLGVIGDEVQLAGAKELGTYIHHTETLKRLIPVMNDTIAHQFGLNASQGQAVEIATMMGKVMDGQAGGLSRYGYTLDEVQKKIIETGTEEEKLKTLIEVVTPVVDGMNESLRNTPEGRVQAVTMAVGDLKERVGGIIVQLQAKLAPIMETCIALTNGIIDIVQLGWPVWIGASVAVLVGVTKIKRELENTSLAALLSGGSFTTFGAMAKAACRKISTAITSIPIVGWIAGSITIIIGVFTTLWSKCEAFRGFLTGAWEVVKNVIHNIWGIVQPVIAKVFNTIKSVIGKIADTIRAVIDWVRGVFSKVKEWFSKVMQPVADWFKHLYDKIKDGISKIIEWMAKPLNKLIDLWNKITGGSAEKFKVGFEKGASKVRENKGIAPAGLPGMDDAIGLNDKPMQKATKGAEATVTGGTRNTTVNITLGKMIENIIFNGTLGDNAQNLERQVQEILYRTLAMAAATA